MRSTRQPPPQAPAQEVYRCVPFKPLRGQAIERLLLQMCRYFSDHAAPGSPLPFLDDFGLTLDKLQPLGACTYIGGGSYGSVLWPRDCPEVVKIHYAASRHEILALVRELLVGAIVSAGRTNWLPDPARRYLYDGAPFSTFIYAASGLGIWTPSEEDAARVAARLERKGARPTFASAAAAASTVPLVDVADLMEHGVAEAHRHNVFKSVSARTEPYSLAGYTGVVSRAYADSRTPLSYFLTASKLVPGAKGTTPGRTFGAAIAKDARFTATAGPVCGVVYCTAFILSQLREMGAEHRDLSVANIVLAERVHVGALYKVPIFGDASTRLYDAAAVSFGLVPIIIDPSEMHIGVRLARQTLDNALRVNQVAAFSITEQTRDSVARWIATKSDAGESRTFSSDIRRLWLHITTVLLSVIKERAAGTTHGDAVRSVSAQLLYLCVRFTFVMEDEWDMSLARPSMTERERTRVDNFFSYSRNVTALLRTLLRCHKLEPVAVIGRETLLRSIDSCKVCIDRLLSRLNYVMDVTRFPANSYEERFLSCTAVMNWAPLKRLVLAEQQQQQPQN